MPSQVKIGLERFRAFARSGKKCIKPITILVGENSTGKTSFLAALRFALRIDGQEASYFNVYPFELGTFEDIAYRNEDGTVAKSFAISIEKTIDLAREGSITVRQSDQSDVVDATLKVKFKENFGEVVVDGFEFSFEDVQLFYDMTTGPNFRLTRNGRDVERMAGQAGLFKEWTSRRQLDLRQLNYLVFERFFVSLVTSSSGKRSRAPDDPARRVSKAFDAFVSSTYEVKCSPPVRSLPRRVYTSSDDLRNHEASQAPYELNRAKRTDRRRWTRLNERLNSYGKLSGLFTRFNVAKLTRQDSGPFQLKVTVRGRPSNIVDVGYGVSQALPIMTDLINNVSAKSAFLFQQPEVHLHPKAQAALGTMFAEYIMSNLNSFIVVETHSDYLIDRLRIEAKEGRIPHDMIQILYFCSEGKEVEIKEILVDSAGNLVGAPKEYREFFIKEQERILGF